MNKSINVVSAIEAKYIMKGNFFNVNAVGDFLNIKIKKSWRKKLESLIPYSRETLVENRKNCVLYPVLPISIMEMYTKFPHLFQESDSFKKQKFAHKRNSLGWKLIETNLIHASISKNKENQLSLVERDHTVPNVQELVFAIIVDIISNKRSFQQLEKFYTRTMHENNSLIVGKIQNGGIGIIHHDDKHRTIGLLTSIKQHN